MKNLPGGAELLAIARETLLAELKSPLPDNARYIAAMIANAMAIAAREAEAGEAPAIAALDRLDRLHGDEPRVLHGAALRDAVAAHERRLAADIRAGRYDSGEKSRAALAHPRESVNAKLSISNPKALD
jgi:hypothetical protein